MEMEYHDDSKRRKVFIVLGVVLAVVAGGAAFFLVNQAQSAGNAAVATRQVVVAARDLPVRTVIAASDVAVRSVPEDPSVATAYTTPEEVVGRITGAPILFQQAFTPNLLASTTAGSGFSILGPDETIAPDSPGVARRRGLCARRARRGRSDRGRPACRPAGHDPGQRRSRHGGRRGLIASGGQTADESTGTGAATPVRRARTTATSRPRSPTSTSPSWPSTDQLYIIKVDLNQAEEINHLAASGNAVFSMVLRPEGDDRTVDTTDYGETTNQIIEKYGLPIPQVYPVR